MAGTHNAPEPENAPRTQPASEYPEHDKMLRISAKSQAIGEFLEWLGEGKGIHLMTWVVQDEEIPCAGGLLSGCKDGRTDTGGRCSSCKGTSKQNLHFEGWLSQRQPIQELLAEHFEIDLKVIEQEKRAMLDRMREVQS